MATLVNNLNSEVKVIIPNMREFRTFYSDNEGVIGMFFKRDWHEQREESKESTWKPTEEQMKNLEYAMNALKGTLIEEHLQSLYNDLMKR